MLMQIGALRFEVAPLNTDANTHDHGARYAEKPVLGARPPMEWIGEGRESWSISAKLFPQKFGGLSSLDLLYQMRAAGNPVYLMRGDGSSMGWVVVTDVSEKSAHLNALGVGQVIDVTISVTRSERPAPGDYFGSILSSFSEVIEWAGSLTSR